MKTKKKNFIIPFVLIIIIIIILVIVLTKTHKKDKFDYSNNSSISNLKAKRESLNITYFNQSNETSFVQIYMEDGIKTRYTNLIIGGILEPNQSKSGIFETNRDPPFLLYTYINRKKFDPVDIDTNFDYNVIQRCDITNPCIDIIATIPEYPFKKTDPIFKIVNKGDITFEYTMTIYDSRNNPILLYPVSNNKCNNGKGYVSNWFSVPENSKVSITYNSCSLPDFSRTLNFTCEPKGIYQITQTRTYSFWKGVWFPNLTYQGTIG